MALLSCRMGLSAGVAKEVIGLGWPGTFTFLELDDLATWSLKLTTLRTNLAACTLALLDSPVQLTNCLMWSIAGIIKVDLSELSK